MHPLVGELQRLDTGHTVITIWATHRHRVATKVERVSAVVPTEGHHIGTITATHRVIPGTGDQDIRTRAGADGIVAGRAHIGAGHANPIDAKALWRPADEVRCLHLTDATVAAQHRQQLARRRHWGRCRLADYVRQVAICVNQQWVHTLYRVATNIDNGCVCTRVVKHPDTVIVVVANRVVGNRQPLKPGERHDTAIDAADAVAINCDRTVVDVHRVCVIG